MSAITVATHPLGSGPTTLRADLRALDRESGIALAFVLGRVGALGLDLEGLAKLLLEERVADRAVRGAFEIGRRQK